MSYRTSIETPYRGQTLHCDGDAVAPSLRQVCALMAEAREARAQAARELASVIERSQSTLRLEHWRPDGAVIRCEIAPDPSSEGLWMLERSDDRGPFNATGYLSLTEAIEDALREGFVLGPPPHAIEPVRIEVAVANGQVTDVASRLPASVLLVDYDVKDVEPLDMSGPVMRSRRYRLSGTEAQHGRHELHESAGEALERFACVDELAKVARQIVRLGIPVEALTVYLTGAFASGMTACRRVSSDELVDESSSLVKQCIEDGRSVVDVLAFIKDGGQWQALAAMVEEVSRVQRMLAYPCDGPEARQTAVDWARTAGIRVEDDPDQPGCVLWRSADGEGCDVSLPSQAEAARSALAHLFPYTEFVEQLAAPCACREYDAWLATCSGSVSSATPASAGPGM